MVFVDDGSKDNSYRVLSDIYEHDRRVNVVRLRRNFGQTPALKAGFDFARGEVVISMDGDLQHDPEEIPRFLEKIEEGYDLVSGWRCAAQRSLVDAPGTQPYRQLADGQAERHRTARFRHHLQSVPPRNSAGNSALRRTPPLHPRAGQLHRRAHRGSAHLQSRAQERQIQLRHRPQRTRIFRLDHDQVPAGLFHQAATIFWLAGTGRIRHRVLARRCSWPWTSSSSTKTS